MTNVEAAQHLREALDGQFRGSFGAWREAMEKAITALEHQPEPQLRDMPCEVLSASTEQSLRSIWKRYNVPPERQQELLASIEAERQRRVVSQQCINCGAIIGIQKAICPCGSTELHVIRSTAGTIELKGKMEGEGREGGDREGEDRGD